MRLTAGGVRRLGAPRAGLRRARWSPRSAASTCSRPDAAIPPDDYVASLDEVGIDYERLDATPGRRPVAAVPPARRHARAATRRTRRSCPAGRGTAVMQQAGRAGTAPSCCDRPRSPGCATSATGIEVATDAGRGARCRGVVVCADAWTNDVLGRLGVHGAARGDARAGDLLRARATRRGSRPDGCPLWIWMDDPSFYGFPCYGEADGQGGPGLRRPVGRPRRPRPTTPTRTMERAAGRRTCAAMLPGVGRAGAVAALPVHADPRPRLRARRRCPATRTSSSGWAPRTASSSRRRSAGCSPTSPPTGATATDLVAVPARPAGAHRPRLRRALAGVSVTCHAQRARRSTPELGGEPGRPPSGAARARVTLR